MVIIGWSFVRRQEVWYYGNNGQTIDTVPDNQYSRLITLDYLLNNSEATLEQQAMIPKDLHIHKQLTDFYTDLYLFSQYLKFKNIDYFWFSAARNTDCPIDCFPYLMSLTQVQSIAADPRIFQLHEFCIQDWAKANDSESNPLTGHLSKNGHKQFANYLYQLL